MFGREHFDKFADIGIRLLLDDRPFDIFVLQFKFFEDIAIGAIGDDRHLIIATEIVDDEVVRDTHHPMDKLIFVLIDTRIDGDDDLKKSILKNIVSDITVLNDREDIAVDFSLMASQENLEASIVTLLIALNQLVVGESLPIGDSDTVACFSFLHINTIT